jgi:hypothetical protein
MSKSSTSVNRKALKLDNKVKAIIRCDVGKSCGRGDGCWSYPNNEHSYGNCTFVY